jgi:antitoxin (DNA-binding transcriptional repressor) of toxin-antitoxin stability system
MIMKTINVTELNAHLSRYLRLASRGSRIVVTDRDHPIAQLGPLEAPAESWRERMIAEGRLRAGTQVWDDLVISPLDRPVNIQESLREVREDPSEVGRR